MVLAAFALALGASFVGYRPSDAGTDAPKATDSTVNDTMTCRALNDGLECDLVFVADDEGTSGADWATRRAFNSSGASSRSAITPSLWSRGTA